MGRPRKWQPRRLFGEMKNVKKVISEFGSKKSAFDRNFRRFAKLNRRLKGPRLILAMAEQQLADKVDPSVVANNIETARKIHLDSPSDLPTLQETISALRRKKARLGGPKRKPWYSATNLWSVVIDALDITDKQSARYASLWWLLIATGMRPNEAHHCHCKLKDHTIEVTFFGRKNETSSSAAACVYDLKWTIYPPVFVREYYNSLPERHTSVTAIGTAQNVASCIDSFLKRRVDERLLSTLPRVSLDNLLRRRLTNGELSEKDFERLMGHDIETSTTSYLRTSLEVF